MGSNSNATRLHLGLDITAERTSERGSRSHSYDLSPYVTEALESLNERNHLLTNSQWLAMSVVSPAPPVQLNCQVSRYRLNDAHYQRCVIL